MKYFFLFLTFFLYSFTLQAAEKTLLCLPNLDPSYRSMTFQIKPSKGTCEKDEKIFEIKRGEGQAVLLIPYEAPSSQPAHGIPGNPSLGRQLGPY